MRAAPVVPSGWRLPVLARRELAALVGDAERAAWLIGWAEYLLADLLEGGGLEAFSARDRKHRFRRVEAASGELLAALGAISHKSHTDSMLQFLIEQAAAENSVLPPPFDDERLSLSDLVVSLYQLQAAALRLGAMPVPPGRQLDDRHAVACDVFRLALMACGIKDARSADSKMGAAFAVFLQAGGLARSDVRSLLQALANWRQSHPSDTGLYLGFLG
ncbi:hypothetical protein [Pseudaquabacterium pictum]|uniref:Uncharacterized protein n=1 Tax=Pseudaquabacterium pictum TaxID=2315236 RepID=A0A480AMZ7_9BURK|nr:hypothetical protein [Rubrivivax pictus]GCL61025.1 hypothetical protein AQPW35_01060 [Rubrivivax pictus]